MLNAAALAQAKLDKEQEDYDNWKPPTDSWEVFWAKQEKAGNNNYIMRSNLFETPHMKKELAKIHKRFYK